MIIGYTFPLYNRMIDSSYMNYALLMNHNDKLITIQDPHAESICSTLTELMGHPKTFEQLINKKTDCLSFYVPSNIYIKPDSTSYPIVTKSR